jgi:type IV secretory pathway VirB10-like protein
VVFDREHRYELNGDDSRSLATIGAFRVVSERDLQDPRQAMNRFLNRLPTITIREGHRVKVYLTSDLELPSYAGTSGRF